MDGVNGDDGNGGTGWSDAFATIGKALSVAGDYDLVLVADATYNETDLDFGGKRIYLKGVDHNNAGAQPIIDCQGSGRAFYFHTGETEDSVVDNFVIKNGSISDGGAIYCKNSSSPLITNCAFIGNSASKYGGAIACWHCSSPTITNCTFIGNSANQCGGAISCITFNWPTIISCIFIDNSAADGGGAIDCIDSGPNIINCTFSGNSAMLGGAIHCTSGSGPGSGSSPTLDNCILWGDSAAAGANEIYADSGCSVALNYCCVDNSADAYGGGGTVDDTNNCIHDDPQFVDAAGGDYHLKDTSPCIDAGDNALLPSGVDKDLDGNQRITDGDNDGTATVDIGAYEYQP